MILPNENNFVIRRNVIANYTAKAWGFISAYLFVPLYIKFLGFEAFGLVGFYTTLLGVLVFADLGFSATLSREMARLSVRKEPAAELRDLLRTYELAYLWISLLLIAITWVLAPMISEHWLRSEILHPRDKSAAIRLMGIAIAFQFPAGLYFGGLMGLQQQVRANTLQVVWSSIRGIGAVLVIWIISSTIFAFFIWQVISNVFYCILVRQNLWRFLSKSLTLPRPRFMWNIFRRTWRYARGMAVMAILSSILVQTDKLVISKMLSLEMLGYYTLAGTIGLLPVLLASPIATAVFPQLTALVEIGDRPGLIRLYHQTCEYVSIAIIPAGLTLAIFANEAILAWTGSVVASQQAGVAASLLLLGQLFQATSMVPYYLSLAHGQTKLILKVQVFSIVFITPLLIWLIRKYGVVGGGASWLFMNACSFPLYIYFLHRRLLPGELRTWFLRDTGRPMLAALPIILLFRWLLPSTSSRMMIFAQIGLVWGVSALAAAAAIPKYRNILLKITGKTLGVIYRIKKSEAPPTQNIK